MAIASARETAYQIIREKIIRLDLKPGEALNDKELAEEMGMSRTPVREAMIMLNIAELVVVRPQSGTFVAPIDLEIVEMEQFTRSAMEKEMIRIACRNVKPEHKTLYEENLHLYAYYEKSKVKGREDKLLELDNEFHRIAFIIDGKEKYYDRMLSNMQHIERLRTLSLYSVQDARIDDDHHYIAKAIMEGNAEFAERKTEEHMKRYLEHLLQIKRAAPQYFVMG